MNTIPFAAQQLLAEQSDLETKLNELEAIINKAERGLLGLTAEGAKTAEWKEAQRLYSIYWNAYRNVNMKLSKMRKAIGYEARDGKRITIYQYK